MQVAPSELFTDWDIPPLVTCALVLAAKVYGYGWLQIHKTRPVQFPQWRLVAFLGGIAAIFVAVSSPLDTFSESLLFMHMGQHFVLMSIAPPLLVLGAPVVPMLRGLPRWLIRTALRPFFSSRTLHSLGGILTRPAVAWIAMNAAYIGWHIPAAYEFALSSESWHNVEHACFLFTGILFWWPIVRPWPFQQQCSRWVIVPYLLLADLVNTALSALLCFSGRLIYPSYGEIERPFGLNALDDQVAAGAFMWVFGSMVFLLPVLVVIIQIFSTPAISKQRYAGTNLHIETSAQLPQVNREAV
jgi:cytochrome c oxidase assembly factor CtaG